MADSRELAEQAFSLLQSALKDSEERAAALDAELRKKSLPESEIEQQASALERRLEAATAECESCKRDLEGLSEALEHERASTQALRKKLQLAESGPDKVERKELNFWRSRAEEFDGEAGRYRERIAQLRKELREAQAQAQQAAEAPRPDADPDELTELRSRLEQQQADLDERDRRIAELTEAEHKTIEERRAISEQMARLEEELREEKECTINLSELANERGEKVTELSEQLDEAVERFEESQWRLERAGRFEQLVVKRRKLIDSLIAELRAKQKANVALKAGIDGLRQFKARAEKQQQDLLLRVDELTSDLKLAKERLAGDEELNEAEAKLSRANETISGLESRLEAQVTVIESLENELLAAKTARRKREDQIQELAELKAALETRDESIARLEADLNEQQRELGKLRGSQSETQRLMQLKQEDQGLIERLQQENDSLRAELMERQIEVESSRNGPGSAIAEEVRKRDLQIEGLEQAVEEYKKIISQLQETAAGWQKKYEFVTTDAPTAYQTQSGEK